MLSIIMAPGGEDFQVDLKLYAPGNHTIAVSALFPIGRGIDRSIIFEGVGLEGEFNHAPIASYVTL